jgi:xylose isomerase
LNFSFFFQGIKCLWGTANLFSHPRYMCGAATNPDAHVFAYAAATVKKAMEVTHRLGGENFVFWGKQQICNQITSNIDII